MNTLPIPSPPDGGEEALSPGARRARRPPVLFFAALLLAPAFPFRCAAQTNCTPAPPGLVSWWRAEGNALDWVGGNNGTLEGDATYGPGNVGQAFVFDGSQSGIEVGDAANLELQQFTVECWIKRLTNTLGGSIFEIGSGPFPHGWSGAGWSFVLNNDGTLVLFDVSNAEESQSSNAVADTLWHHIAVSKGATNLVFYIDGVGYPSTALTNPIAYTGGATIGCETVDLFGPFNGSIDELSIYNRSLSASEIQAIYNAGSAGKCTIPSAPSAISSQPANQAVIVGDNVVLTVSAVSYAPQGYQWSFNGAIIDGGTNSSLELDNVPFAVAGTYAVTVTNAYGQTTSSNAVLTVLPTPPCTPVPAGLISWWRGEGNTIDRVGGNNGTLAGGAGYTAGKVGQGFFVGGDASAVAVGTATNLQLQDFTVECWIRRASASLATEDGSGVGALFAFGSGGYGVGFYDNGQLLLGVVDGVWLQSSAFVTDTNFHHVGVTKSANNVTFYLDGVAYPSKGLDDTFTFTTPAAIGALGDTLASSFYGTIDEMSIYNRPLSAAEIEDIYGVRSSGKCVPPVSLLPNQPVSQTVSAYNPASFSVLADGPLPLLYQWTFDGTNLAGATNSVLSIETVLPSNAGTYSVIVGTPPNTTNSSNAVPAIFLAAYMTWVRQNRVFGTLLPVVCYRGHACAPPKWKLLPTLYRYWRAPGIDDAKKKEMLKLTEMEIVSEFSSRFGLSEKTKLEILAYAQHHGAPTRLLDWSLNPLVALWFAVSEQQYDGEPGVVFQMRVGIEEQVCVAQGCDVNHIDSGKSKSPVFIVPGPAFVDRADRQRGAFSIVSFATDVALMPLDEIVPNSIRNFPIPRNIKAAVRRLLCEIGIDPFTMFGTPDSVGKSWALRLNFSDLNIVSPPFVRPEPPPISP